MKTMIIILAVAVLAALLFGLYLWHVVGFGLRTRRVVIHSDPGSRERRDVRDRRALLWETHVRAPAETDDPDGVGRGR